ncbi:MAG: (2Fe-2S)-binding protein [Desulfurococcaceae archaeon]|jgi:bacterioferritin-associated ferredoxin
MGGEKGPIIVCRCNDVTLDNIVDAIDQGIDDFELLRKYLKIGFGPCQGRSCLIIAARIFAKKTGRRIEEVLRNYQFRPPLVPVSAEVLVAGVEE